MPEEVDLNKLQVTREFTNLAQTLGVRTPRKLAQLAALQKAIRNPRRAKPKVKGR